MVQVSTTLLVAALAVAPALAAPVATVDYESRDIEELDSRAPFRQSSGASSALGRFVGNYWASKQQQQAPSARDFIDLDFEEIDARAPTRLRGLSGTLGRFVGSALGSAANGMVGVRELDVDEIILEARNKNKGKGKARTPQQPRRPQPQPKPQQRQRKSSGLSRTLGNFAGAALGSAANSMVNGGGAGYSEGGYRRDFEELEFEEVARRLIDELD